MDKPIITQTQLRELPAEVLAMILYHTFEWPQDSLSEHDPQACQFMTANLFRNPVSLVCKDLRSRILELLSTHCVWMRVEIPLSGPGGIDSSPWGLVARTITPHLPIVRPSQLSQLSRVNVIQLAAVKRSYHQILHDSTGLFETFLYTFKALTAVVHFIHRLSASADVDLTIFAPGTSLPLADVLKSQVVPSLVFGTGLSPRRFTLNIPDEARPLPETIRRVCNPPTTIHDILWLVQENLRFANSLETHRPTDASKTWVLHCSWLFDNMKLYLPSADSWNHGETDPDEHIHPQSSQNTLQHFGRNVIGNEIRHCLHEIDYRASRAFVNFYEAFGASWVEEHDRLYCLLAPHRYSDTPELDLFSLSTTEIAEFEYGRALTERIIQSIENRRRYCERNFTDPLWCREGARYDPRLNPLWARALLTSYLMQPDNAEFKAAAEKALDCFDDEEDRKGIAQWAMDRLDKVEEVQGLKVDWLGPRYILDTFGNIDVLRYLPLARQRLDQ